MELSLLELQWLSDHLITWQWQPDWLCLFCRMTKCTFHKFGTSGNIEKHDALCILPLNIGNCTYRQNSDFQKSKRNIWKFINYCFFSWFIWSTNLDNVKHCNKSKPKIILQNRNITSLDSAFKKIWEWIKWMRQLACFSMFCLNVVFAVNEKIYIFIWFWLLFLGFLSSVVIVYRIVIVFSPYIRAFVLRLRYRFGNIFFKLGYKMCLL